MTQFYVLVDKKQQYLNQWIQTIPEYQRKRRLVNFLYILSGGLLLLHIFAAILIFLRGDCAVDDFGVIVGLGTIIASIPFSFAVPISIKAKRSCGVPYSNRKEECLVLYDDGVEFIFHNCSSPYEGSKNVYRIPIENINAVRYDSKYHIVTIIGEGQLLWYDDYPSRRLNHQRSQRRFYSNSPYSILMAFENEKAAVEKLCSMAKNFNQ